MQKKFGWKMKKMQNSETKNPENRGTNDTVYSENDLIKYKFMTSFDDELYAYAEYINRAQLESLLYRNNYSNLGDTCSTSCCCDECSVYK